MTRSTIENFSMANQAEGHVAFRLQGVDHLPVMAQEESCHILKQYFDFLDSSLSSQEESADIGLLQEMLLEISLLLRSDKSPLRDDAYLRLLNRLTAIYAKGLKVENDWAFTSTAANFADILESISQRYQDYDYSHSVGLLLHYMDKLFNSQEESWIDVFEHLLSMPDSIRIMQQLKNQHLQEIQNWVEEGVDNLFTIRDEQFELIANLDKRTEDLEKKIVKREQVLLDVKQAADREGIAVLLHQQERREIESLNEKQLAHHAERKAKLEIIKLLDDNIQEFADRLTEIRRSTLIRLVWSNPDTPK